MFFKMTHHPIILTVLLLVVLFTSQLSAQEEIGVGFIRGRVVDTTNKPVAQAKVMYKHKNQANFVFGAYTDEKGNFISNKFESGIILDILIKADGYEDLWENMIVEGINPDTRIFKLNPVVVPIKWDFQISHRNPENIFSLLRSHFGTKKVHNLSPTLRTISVLAPPEDIEEMKKLVKKYDSPLKQVWVEVVIIEASGNGSKKPKLPPELSSIVDKLQSLFKFGRYEVIGRADAMGLEGATISFGTGYSEEEKSKSIFEARARIGYADDIIKLENLSVHVVKPSRSELATSINIRNGETVILGASRGDALSGSLITVVRAQVAE